MKNLILLFDLDKTLIQIDGDYDFFDQIIIDVFRSFNLPEPPLKERDKLWRNIDFKDLLKSWNFNDSKKFWKKFDEIDFKKRKEYHKIGKVILFPDVKPFFDKIKNYPYIYSSVITNTTQEIAEFELNTFQIKDYFHSVYGFGENQNNCKPSPTGIKKILSDYSKNIKFDNEDVYIIGDSSTDINAGKNANIKTVLLKREEILDRHRELKPDFIIKNLDELLYILKIN